VIVFFRRSAANVTGARETKKKNQVRRETKQLTARAQQRISLHAAQAKKLRKPNRWETPEAKLRHKSCASPTRNKQQIQSRDPNKIITCHNRSNKKLRKPNRKPRKLKHNKKLITPDAKQNNQPRASSTKQFPLRRSNKKLRKPKSRRPRKRNSDTKIF
jgi:hypothetical protein